MTVIMKGTGTSLPKRQPMKQKRSIKAENTFIKAAETIFRQNGYAGTRIQDIIEHSGYSTGSFYNCFTDKMGLYEVVLQRYLEEATSTIAKYDMTRETNGDLYQLFVSLMLTTRKTISDHLGCYRAAYELAGSHPECFEPLFQIGERLQIKLKQTLVQYHDQMDTEASGGEIDSACQLILMSGLQTELDMAKFFPQDQNELAHTIARAACGIVRYNRPFP